MKDFLDKWKKDKKYQTKIKLLVYTSFVVIVSIFAISNRNITANNQLEEYDNNLNNKQEEPVSNNELIEILQKYNYTINININDKEYEYVGIKTQLEEKITKKDNENIKNYIYKDGNYYIEENENHILTTENEVYNLISKNYLELSTINIYLSKSIKQDNQNIVYLKDIILGDNTDDYIIIEKNENKINIDYTSLINNFNKNINKCLVNIKIEEIE